MENRITFRIPEPLLRQLEGESKRAGINKSEYLRRMLNSVFHISEAVKGLLINGEGEIKIINKMWETSTYEEKVEAMDKKITIRLPDELYDRIKQKCERQGKTISDYVRCLLS